MKTDQVYSSSESSLIDHKAFQPLVSIGTLSPKGHLEVHHYLVAKAVDNKIPLKPLGQLYGL